MNFTPDQIMNIFVLFMGCLFVFVLIREVICWYWKINKGILLQEKILAELVKSNNKPVELCDRVLIDNTGDIL
jgi:hypothetical protein